LSELRDADRQSFVVTAEAHARQSTRVESLIIVGFAVSLRSRPLVATSADLGCAEALDMRAHSRGQIGWLALNSLDAAKTRRIKMRLSG